MHKTIFTFAIALLLTGCGLLGDGGVTYPVALKDARAKLLQTEPPMFLFGEQAANARVSRDSDGTVRWLLVDKLGTGLLSLVARTEATDPQNTRITVSIEPPPGGLKDQVAKGIAENSTIVAFYKAAMEEQIAASFQNREFDMAAIQDEMMTAAFANVDKIGDSMDKAAAASKEREKDHQYQQGWSSDSDTDTSYGSSEQGYGDPGYNDPAEEAEAY